MATPAVVAINDDTGMTESELAAILAEHETRSVSYYTSEIANEQTDALNRYYRRPYGDERAGRSQVVDGTVGVVIDNAVAAILKPFVSAEDTVVFNPRGKEDEKNAAQATEYINYVFQCDCNGFMVLHDWVKEALLLKLGVTKTYWEDYTSERKERLENLDPMQAAQIQQEGGEIYGPDETGLYSADVMNTYADGKICIDNVPIEEYRISPYSRPGRTAPYEAHIRALSRSELIEMGFDSDMVMSLAKWAGDLQSDQRSQARYQDEDAGGIQLDMPGDSSRELIEVAEEYVLVDFDGDGKSELRKVIRSGTVILLNEEVDEGPFATLCPVPMPHKIIGLSLADLVLQDQRISTVVIRQTLDNLYLANNPRVVVPEGAERKDGTTIDDLLDPSPGGPIRTAREGVEPFAIPFVADKSFAMLDYLQQQVEQKTGIRKSGNGLDRDSLNKNKAMTATQASQIEDKENERVEMIARIFAETGIKKLFKLMLKLLVNHQPRARMIRLRNEWVPMDPRGWDAEMDLSISVGLGVGNKMEQMAQAQTVVSTMAELSQGPFSHLINSEKAYNALKRLFQAAGIKNTDDFLVEPEKDEQGNTVEPEPQPSPEQQKAQADAMLQAQKMQQDAQLAAQKQQAAEVEAALKMQLAEKEAAQELELARQKAAAEIDLAREKAQAEAILAREQMAQEAELERERMALQDQASERQAQRDHEVALEKNRAGGDLDK